MTILFRNGVLPAAILALGLGSATAQDASNVLVSGDLAKRALAKNEISLEAAKRIVDYCVEQQQQRGAPISLVVLTPGGGIKYAVMTDGHHPVQIDTALMKAKTALYMRESTHAWNNRLEGSLQTELRLLPLGQYWQGGGLPIIFEDQVIGAVGEGGNAQAERCLHEAMTRFVGPQPPLPEGTGESQGNRPPGQVPR